jgi:iron complex transport system substrate-binding protein
MPFVRLRLRLAATLTLLAAACGGGRDGADTTAAPDTARARDASRSGAAPHAAVRDDFGDTLVVSRAPSRIVSLNPTTTEALFAMGAGARLIGRSHWDQWPVAARALPDLGPGIRPSLERVLAAKPDLVLLYASADNRSVAARLRQAGVATLAFKTDRIEEFRQLMRTLGTVVGDTAAARAVVDSVNRTLDSVRTASARGTRPSVLIPTWDDPLIVIGGGSHMSELVEIAGGRNVYAEFAQPSPQVSMEDVLRRDPDVVLTGPEGRRRILASPAWRTLRAVKAGRVFAYDTMVVGRPSPAIGAAAANISSLLRAAGRP